MFKISWYILADITHGNPRLVAHCRGFGKVYAMDVFQGLMAASGHHGNVMLINHHGVMWKRKSEGEFGWMARTFSSNLLPYNCKLW